MSITITIFENSPDQGRGQARDFRVRWALEEVGLPYTVRPLSFAALRAPESLAIQPFGQIPAFTDGDLQMFESGAIVLHVAERGTGLLPTDPAARARATSWMFAALNSVEPPIVEREVVEYLERDRSWAAERLAMVDGRVLRRLGQLAEWLGDRPWLEESFSAGDLLMVTVLRRLEGSGLVEHFPNLAGYVARGQARPAFQRAFAAQEADFRRLASAR